MTSFSLQMRLAPRSFGRSVLTRCEAFLDEGDHQQAIGLLSVEDTTAYRSVIDFVLVAVLPQFLPDVVAYYEGTGPQLREKYSEGQIDRIDRFVVRVLRNAYRLSKDS